MDTLKFIWQIPDDVHLFLPKWVEKLILIYVASMSFIRLLAYAFTEKMSVWFFPFWNFGEGPKPTPVLYPKGRLSDWLIVVTVSSILIIASMIGAKYIGTATRRAGKTFRPHAVLVSIFWGTMLVFFIATCILAYPF